MLLVWCNGSFAFFACASSQVVQVRFPLKVSFSHNALVCSPAAVSTTPASHTRMRTYAHVCVCAQTHNTHNTTHTTRLAAEAATLFLLVGLNVFTGFQQHPHRLGLELNVFGLLSAFSYAETRSIQNKADWNSRAGYSETQSATIFAVPQSDRGISAIRSAELSRLGFCLSIGTDILNSELLS